MSMKKTLLALLLVIFAFSAKAQFNFGGQFSINFGNERTSYNSGVSTNKENAHMINLKPKIYWNLNEKMQIGGRIGFAYGRLTTGIIYDSSGEEAQREIIHRAVGWSLSPFFGYRLLTWKRISVWAEANLFFGQTYNVEKSNDVIVSSKEWNRQSEYGFQILPVVNIDLKDNLALQLHAGFISLGWYGTTSRYPDRVVTTSTCDLHKGGFAGIAQGLLDYGIGLVKKF